MNIHLGLQKLLQVVSFHLVGALRRDSGRTTVDRDKKKTGCSCDHEVAFATVSSRLLLSVIYGLAQDFTAAITRSQTSRDIVNPTGQKNSRARGIQFGGKCSFNQHLSGRLK